MLQRHGLAFVLSGPSGSGKTSLCRAARDQLPGLTYSVSHTTRSPRPGEVDGEHYHFVDEERFEAMIAAGELLEWAEVYRHRYGTARATVLSLLQAGRDVILDLDIQGSLALRAAYPHTRLLFVLPPSRTVLEERLRGRRTDPGTEIDHRLSKALVELEALDKFDYFVENDEFARALQEVGAIVSAERQAVSHLVEPTPTVRLLFGGSHGQSHS
ncbi:MAG: guanylate kinase [Deltaproteobacteria bacterium RIFOXYA12_FULL_61_11]|nr:MAG: guanylate kinase [Deltaproteobacteria bacterium RIFOXYA12_FULL_61_11]